MSWARVAVLGCLVAGCVHGTRPAEPPRDARRRWEAEADACYGRTLPTWLDDSALAAAARLDQMESQASRANDSFRGSVFTSQPPAVSRGARAAALLEERRAFQEWCALLRSSGKGASTTP